MDPLSIGVGLWRFATSKLGIGLLAAILLGALWLRGNHYRSERDELKVWQDDVTLATRNAAHRPKLAAKHVAQQVRYLGKGLDDVRTAMARVKAKALADKLAADTRNEERRKDADHALRQDALDAHRRTDAYALAHRVPGLAGKPAAVGGGDDGERDLPGAALGAPVPDGAGAETELVTITRTDLDICTINTVRLVNGHDWAAGLSPKPEGSR